MAADGKHPHIDSPTESQLLELMADRPAHIAEVYLRAHALVVATLPDVRFSVDTVDAQIGYGARQYGYNGWGMAALAPFANWASLAFMVGSTLDDPDGLLEGSGAKVRHVKIRSAEQLATIREGLVRLIEQAARAKAE